MAEPRAKKTRYNHMAVPDGFKNTSSKPKSQQKIAIPKFTSAFDMKCSSSSKQHGQLTTPFEDTDLGTRAIPKFSAPSTTLKPPVLPLKDQEVAVGDYANDRIRLKDLQRFRTNILPESLSSTNLPSTKTTSSASALTASFKALPITPICHTKSEMTKPLRPFLLPLHPPNYSRANTPKDMRAISKTHIALATDLSTENGAAEIASIFLQDQHSDVISSVSDTKGVDMRRNLALSPENVGKNKGSAFIRKGLAARACSIFTESRMAMSLWRKEIELHSNRQLTADLSMLIVKILYTPPIRHPQVETNLTNIFTLCTRIPGNSSKELHRILFSFPSVESNGLFYDATQFVEGSVVHIWSPWQELLLQEGGSQLTGLDYALPTSLPIRVSGSLTPPDLAHFPISNTVLFSSRFVLSSSV